MESDSVESISTWSVYQVAHFVSALVGTEIYSKVLKDNNVNGKVLLNCKLEEWKGFGIHVLAHRAALFGWAQGRINDYQERVSMQHRISVESSNKARNNKELEKPNNIETTPSSKLTNGGNKFKKMPTKAVLKESYCSQSRVCNDNMKDMRKWFKDGVGRFSRQEFLTGNLKKNKELKAAIIELIERRKNELTMVTIDGEPYAWSTEEIFTKVMTQRNYQKKPMFEARGGESYAGSKSSDSCELNAKIKEFESVAPQEAVYIPSMGEVEQMGFHDNAKTSLGDVCYNVPTTTTLKATTTLKDTFLAVTMFGSPFFIPEQVIQFRQDRLAARKAVIEYRYFQEFDEGMIAFGSSTLVQRDFAGPYEKWEVEVTDLAIGSGMRNLLLPGTNRAASTIRIGERLILPAVYLLMSETVPISESNHAEGDQINATSMEHEDISRGSDFDYFVLGDNNGKSDALLSDEQTIICSNEDMEDLDHSRESEDRESSFQHDQDKESHDLLIVKAASRDILIQNMEGNEMLEASDNINGEASNIGTMGPAARRTNHNVNDENANAEATNIMTMGHEDGRASTLLEKLVCKYRSVDMNSALAIQATLCSEEAFRQKRFVTTTDGGCESQEATNCKKVKENGIDMDGKMKEKKFLSLNSQLIQAGAKKRPNINTCEKGLKKKVLKDVTNSPLQIPKKDTAKNIPEVHVSVVRGKRERLAKLPLRYRD